MNCKKSSSLFSLSLLLGMGMSACGGGGGGGGSTNTSTAAGGTGINPDTPISSETAEDVNNIVVSASAGTLALDSNISIIPSSDPGASLVLSLADSDFSSFKADTFTWEPSQQPLKMLNNLMCVFSRTGYHLNANEGPFLAKVTMDDCFRSSEGGAAAGTQAGGEGSSSQSSQPVNVTVQSVKEENEPLVASIWFTKEGDTNMYLPGFNMYAQVTIAEPMSDENPFGIFNLKWQAYQTSSNTETTTESMYGYIDVGKQSDGNVLLKFRGTDAFGDSFSTWSITNEAIAVLTVDTAATGADRITAGLARTAQSYGWSSNDGAGGGTSGSDQSGSYAIAFDKERIVTKYSRASENDYMYPTGIDPEAATCRTRNENYANIFSYAFFKSDGTRLRHQTGYPIVTDKLDEWGYPVSGWVDSWGLYIYGVEDGETVYIQDNAGNKTPYTYVELKGTLRNDLWQSVTIAAASQTFTCTSNCLKASISQSDVSNWTMYETGVGPYTYTWDATTKELKSGGTAVAFQSDVTDGWASMSLTDASGSTFQYELVQSQWSQSGALKDSSNNYFAAPGAIEFATYTYNDATDAYPGNSNSSADGKTFSLTYDGWSLQGIDWADLGRTDQFGGSVWGPEISLAKGTVLTVGNTIAGVVTAGEKITLAPAWVELQPKIVTDCSEELQNLVVSAPSILDLPEELSTSERDIKSAIGAKPTKSSDNSDLVTKVKDGEAF